MTELSSKQLRRAADIQDKIEKLKSELQSILGGDASSNGGLAKSGPTKKRRMSAAARAKISAAQKARWKKVKAAKE